MLGGGSGGHKQQKGGEMCRPCSTYARVSWPGSGGRQCNVYLSSLLIECFFFILVKMERAGNAWRARRASRTSEKRQRYMVWNQKSCIGSGNKIHVKGCLSRKDRKHTLGYAFSIFLNPRGVLMPHRAGCWLSRIPLPPFARLPGWQLLSESPHHCAFEQIIV